MIGTLAHDIGEAFDRGHQVLAVRKRGAEQVAVALQALAHGIEAIDSSFTDEVTRTYDVPVGEVASFVEELRERTAGKADIKAE